MSDNKNFFKASPELEHSQSDMMQGSLDPMGQDSLDPYMEEVETAFVAEESASVVEQTVESFIAQDAPPLDYAESFNTSPSGAEDYSRPPVSNVMSSESGAGTYNQPYGGGMTPPPVPPKKKANGVLIAVIAAAVLLVGCLGVFGYFVISDRQEAVAQEEADQSAAQHVRDLIAAIGAVSLGSGDAIVAARSAYDALTTDQKDLVTNYSALTTAEKDYQELVAAEEDRKAEEARQKAEEERVKSTLVSPGMTEYCGDFMITADSGLVLRYGPSQSYNKIVTMPYGSWVDVWAWSGEWAYVSYLNYEGWCNASYLW